MSAVAYEPIIVTTLRRYVRRGASGALLHRIAGGARHWRAVNEAWDIDGTADLAPAGWASRPRLALGDDVLVLGCLERRIAIGQIVAECERRGLQCPRPDQLARYLGCAPRVVLDDLRLLALSTGPSQTAAGGASGVAARGLG